MSTDRGYVTQLGMDPEEAIAHAGSTGFDFVELMMDGAGERRNLDAPTLRSRLDEHDLDLLVHLPFALDIGSPFEHVRAGAVCELESAIDTAAELGARKGVLHASSDAWSPAWDDETIHAHLLGSVRDLDTFGRERGVEICVENIPGGFFSTYDFDALFAETDAAMTFDTGHARIDGLDADGMATLVERHPDRISHFHLNDTRQPADEHLPFGAGTIDFSRLFETLATVGWEGSLSLEVFTLDFEYVETSRERLDRLLAAAE